MKKYYFLGSILSLALILTGCSNFSREPAKGDAAKGEEDLSTLVLEEPFKIGFMGPLTGDHARYGESIKRGVELAKKEAGVKNLEVIYEDSQCDGKAAVNAINTLITVNKVSAIIGEACSGATLAVAPIAEQQRVVMISPASSGSKLTEFSYVFRTVPSDLVQGMLTAQLVYEEGYRRLAILYSNEEYEVGFEKILREKFNELGGEVVISEAVPLEATELKTTITKVKAAEPEAVYVLTQSPITASSSLRQIKEFEIDAALFGGEELKSTEVMEGAGAQREGLVVISISSGTKEFRERYEKEYGVKPGTFAAQGYDAFIALVRALETGAQTGEEIQKALVNVSFVGVTGVIDFDERGDVAPHYNVEIVKDGVFVPFADGEAEVPEPTEILD